MSDNASASTSRPYQRRIRKIKTSPQLEIIETPLSSQENGATHTEFRVYNWRILSSGRLVRGDETGLLELVIVACLVYWPFFLRVDEASVWNLNWRDRNIRSTGWKRVLGLGALLIVLWNKCRTVLYESVTPLPGLGLQISTTRGLSLPHPLLLLGSRPSNSRLLLPLFCAQRFIPLSTISTIIINERLTRWSVRYYLAIILREGEGVVVLLDNMRQNIAVMKEIYHGTREILFDDFDDDIEEKDDLIETQKDVDGGDSATKRRRSKKRRK